MDCSRLEGNLGLELLCAQWFIPRFVFCQHDCYCTSYFSLQGVEMGRQAIFAKLRQGLEFQLRCGKKRTALK